MFLVSYWVSGGQSLRLKPRPLPPSCGGRLLSGEAVASQIPSPLFIFHSDLYVLRTTDHAVDQKVCSGPNKRTSAASHCHVFDLLLCRPPGWLKWGCYLVMFPFFRLFRRNPLNVALRSQMYGLINWSHTLSLSYPEPPGVIFIILFHLCRACATCRLAQANNPNTFCIYLAHVDISSCCCHMCILAFSFINIIPVFLQNPFYNRGNGSFILSTSLPSTMQLIDIQS